MQRLTTKGYGGHEAHRSCLLPPFWPVLPRAVAERARCSHARVVAREPVEAAASESSEASSSATELCSRSAAGRKCPVSHITHHSTLWYMLKHRASLQDMYHTMPFAWKATSPSPSTHRVNQPWTRLLLRISKGRMHVDAPNGATGHRVKTLPSVHTNQSSSRCLRNGAQTRLICAHGVNPGSHAIRCWQASQLDSNDGGRRSPELPGAEGKRGRLSPFAGADAERPLRAQAEVEALLLHVTGRITLADVRGRDAQMAAKQVRDGWLRTGWLRLRTLYKRHVLSDVSTAKCRLLEGCQVACNTSGNACHWTCAWHTYECDARSWGTCGIL